MSTAMSTAWLLKGIGIGLILAAIWFAIVSRPRGGPWHHHFFVSLTIEGVPCYTKRIGPF